MAPLELEGSNLGKKHQHYNKLVDEVFKCNKQLQPIEHSNKDVHNLIKIDVAVKKRDVDYLLEVFKSENLLFVSRAIKRSTWLITDLQYEHIINPDYLYTTLYPAMTSKAFTKLMLNIRIHLKDEHRVEAFYTYLKEKGSKTAYKWLVHCSVPLVEKEVVTVNIRILYLCIKEQLTHEKILRRLFKKSFSIFKAFYNINSDLISIDERIMKTRNSVIKANPNEFLDFLESKEYSFHCRFSPKVTKVLMVSCPNRLLDNFELYSDLLNVMTLARVLPSTRNVKDFLFEQAKNRNLTSLFAHSKIIHFIKIMPKETRFEFVKKVFIDKEIVKNKQDQVNMNSEEISKYENIINHARFANETSKKQKAMEVYMWYKYAPFETAFTDLDKLIHAESSSVRRNSMLQVLLTCAGRNTEYIQTILQYYFDRFINEPFKIKIVFLNFFISKVDTHILTDYYWKILCQLFHTIEVFQKSDNNVQSCVRAIIVRKAIRNEEVPGIIEEKFKFDTLKHVKNKFKRKEKDAVFGYLFDFLLRHFEYSLTTEIEFNEAVSTCELILKLIKDWDKNLCDYPHVLDIIKKLVKNKSEKCWKRDLRFLYNTNKSWRRAMFEESIILEPSEKVCLNALKHDPGLLYRYKEEVLALFYNDKVSMSRLLNKIRTYWPCTIAEDWKTEYMLRLLFNQQSSPKSLVVGLCTLLSQEHLKCFLNKSALRGPHVESNKTKKVQLSLYQQIAKNLHIARPPPSVQEILLFAEEDLMQYAIPSLNAVISQLSPNKCRVVIPLLLDGPVTLIKIGMRYVIYNEYNTSQEKKAMLFDIWHKTKKSVRTFIFKHTYLLMCDTNKNSAIYDMWDVLSYFIDTITPEDNINKIVDILWRMYKIPDSVKLQFYIKSLTFLISLPAKYHSHENNASLVSLYCDCANDVQLMYNAGDELIINVLSKGLKLTQSDFFTRKFSFISSLILCSKDEESQLRRYNICLLPVLDKYLPKWEVATDGKYLIKKNLMTVLECFIGCLETFAFFREIIQYPIPAKTFVAIQLKLEDTLSYQKDYIILTIWKLATTYVKLLKENEHLIANFKTKSFDEMITQEKDKFHNETIELLTPMLARIYVQYLKEDINTFGSSVHLLFAKALANFMVKYLPEDIFSLRRRVIFVNCLLQCGNEEEVRLVAQAISA